MKKFTTSAFGKKIYLLGADADGVKYWLTEPRWECGWYWGFGYIDTYTNNNRPNKALDICSHQHAKDFYSEWCEKKLTTKTFNDDEKWQLCELFDNYYILRRLADAQYNNGRYGNYTSKCNFDMCKVLNEKSINKEALPEVMSKIVSILSGKNAKELENEYKNKVC